MHELPVTQGMLDIVLEKAKEARASKVTRINAVIGTLSGFEQTCIKFYFDCLKSEYGLPETALEIISVPGMLRCRECGNEFSADELPWECPGCGSYSTAITSGNECYVESLEVE